MYFLWDHPTVCTVLASVWLHLQEQWELSGDTCFPASVSNFQSSQERVKACAVLPATFHE